MGRRKLGREDVDISVPQPREVLQECLRDYLYEECARRNITGSSRASKKVLIEKLLAAYAGEGDGQQREQDNGSETASEHVQQHEAHDDVHHETVAEDDVQGGSIATNVTTYVPVRRRSKHAAAEVDRSSVVSEDGNDVDYAHGDADADADADANADTDADADSGRGDDSEATAQMQSPLCIMVSLVMVAISFAVLYALPEHGFPISRPNHGNAVGNAAISSLTPDACRFLAEMDYSHTPLLDSAIKNALVASDPRTPFTAAIIGPDQRVQDLLLSCIEGISQRKKLVLDGSAFITGADAASWEKWVVAEISDAIKEDERALIVLKNMPVDQASLDVFHHCFNENNAFLDINGQVPCGKARFVVVIEKWQGMETTEDGSNGIQAFEESCSRIGVSCTKLLRGAPMRPFIMSPKVAESTDISAAATLRRIRHFLPAFPPSAAIAHDGNTGSN